MIKKTFFGLFLMFLCSCVSEQTEPLKKVYKLSPEEMCPKIEVKKQDSVIVQKVGSEPIFEISIKGFEGFCYYNERTRKNKAVVRPKVLVRRLSETTISTVHFSYYLETSVGPAAYLGQKIYFEKVLMPKDVEDIEYVLDARELQVPEYAEHRPDLYLGLMANPDDSEFRK